MTKTIPLSEVREFMVYHLDHVFSTMLSMKAVPVLNVDLPQHADRVSGLAGIAGDNVMSTVYLHFSASFASKVTAAMLGAALEGMPSETEVNDVVCEVSNMLVNGLKSWLCDAGVKCAASTSAIIRGTAFEIEFGSDLMHECLVFECEEDRFAVEINIKFS